MRCRLLLLFAATFCTAFAAQADWQFTKWGMTLDQVLTASKGAVHKVPYDHGKNVWDIDRGAEGTLSQAGIAYRTEFYFDSRGTLQIVRQTPADLSQCPAVQKAAEAKYGKPVDTPQFGKSVLISAEYWPDKTAKNAVRYTATTLMGRYMGCFLSFVPLEVADSKGYPHFK